MQPIFLTGFMASGKSTLGRALSKATGRQFIDLDLYIENRFRRSISELFAERGEEGFRRLESTLLREVGEMEDVIIACGGGTPCHADNMGYMNSRGLTILLKASIDKTMERILRIRHKRPLIARLDSEEEIREYVVDEIARRQPFYSQAAICIESERLENRSEIAETVDIVIKLISDINETKDTDN